MKNGFYKLSYPSTLNGVADMIIDELHIEKNFPTHSCSISEDGWGTFIDICPFQDNEGMYIGGSFAFLGDGDIVDIRINKKYPLNKFWSVIYTNRISIKKIYTALDEITSRIINALQDNYESP